MQSHPTQPPAPHDQSARDQDAADALQPLDPELHDDLRALRTLHRLATIARDETAPHRDTLNALLAEIVAALGAAAGAISLLNPDSGRLEIEAHTGQPGDARDHSLRPGHGIAGWVALHARARLVPDVAAEPRHIRTRPASRCVMAAPMEQNGQVLGVIQLDHDHPAAFGERDLRLLVHYTREATACVTRLWQLRQLREKSRQLETLITIGQTLVAKLEERELFETVTRDTREIMPGHPGCALYLHEPARHAIRPVSFNPPAPTAPTAPTAADLPRDTDLPPTAPAPTDDDLPPGAPAPAHAGLPLDTSLPLDSCLVASAIHTRRQVEFTDMRGPDFLDLLDLPRPPPPRSLLAAPLIFEDEILGVLAVFTDHAHRFTNDEKRLLAAIASLAAVALQNARLYARVFQSEALLRKNEQLTTLGLLAAEIAHEIRNPLTVLKLLHGALGLDFPAADPRRTDLRVIGEKLDQLEAIVTRVLHFAKAPASLHSRWPLADIIDDTIVLIRLKLAQAKIRLHYEPPPRTLNVNAHKGQLQQVLLNVLLNAMQAMPKGGRITLTHHLPPLTPAETPTPADTTDTTPTDTTPADTTPADTAPADTAPADTADTAPATPANTAPVAANIAPVAAAARPRLVHIDITDTGGGIPENVRDHLFTSFLSGRPDGTGLGLSIARRILASHHGNITLESSSPAGTTLRITLPVA
ncbi:MAG: GAF domain-containing protein [Opitutaceae bacterium]|nr:GAF domain-containing protein [Opitutaceae bacterium]